MIYALMILAVLAAAGVAWLVMLAYERRLEERDR